MAYGAAQTGKTHLLEVTPRSRRSRRRLGALALPRATAPATAGARRLTKRAAAPQGSGGVGSPHEGVVPRALVATLKHLALMSPDSYQLYITYSGGAAARLCWRRRRGGDAAAHGARLPRPATPAS
jgi:hypothetical protein